jgi:catabolite regulation protein CreA
MLSYFKSSEKLKKKSMLVFKNKSIKRTFDDFRRVGYTRYIYIYSSNLKVVANFA